MLGLRNVSDALLTSNSLNDFSDLSAVVVCIGFEEFAKLCEIKNSKTYLILWIDVFSPSLENRIEALVGAIIKKNIESKVVDRVVLLAKYFDYADVFDKY